LAESDKRIPVTVLGCGPKGQQQAPHNHASELDQKLKDISRKLANAPAQLAGSRFAKRQAANDLSESWRLCADLFDSGKEYRLLLEIPGIPKEELRVVLSSREIAIGRDRSAEGQAGTPERSGYTRLLRSITLPEELVAEGAEATLNNGVLEVRIPKKTPTAVSRHRILVR
jgi:HSP20 family protein